MAKSIAMILRLSLFILALFVLGFTPAKAESAYADGIFKSEHFALDNGLQIVVIPNNRSPVVTHMIWYRAGSADEPVGKSGIAHFMEHMMFKGSRTIDGKTLEPGEFSRKVKMLGGNDNAFTSYDYTAYFQSIAKEHLKTVMSMEAGRMQSMNPPQSHIDSERMVILEERSQRTENSPLALLNEQMNASLFINHGYGTPIIGWRHEMQELTRDDVLAWHQKYYAPNNAILIVSGDVNGDEVFIMAQETYGKVKPRAVPTRSRQATPPLPANTVLRFEDARVKQPQFRRAMKGPNYRNHKAAALAMQIAEDIIGNGPTSKLYQSLVVEKKLATDAGLYTQSNRWNAGEIVLYATPAPGISIDTLEAAIDVELTSILLEGFTQDEVERAIRHLQDSAIYARDSLSGPAMIFGHHLITGSIIDDIEYWQADIETIKSDDVTAAARLYLSSDKNRYISGHLLPKDDTMKGSAP